MSKIPFCMLKVPEQTLKLESKEAQQRTTSMEGSLIYAGQEGSRLFPVESATDPLGQVEP